MTVQKVAEPVIKLYNRLAGRFENVFDGFFRTFDDLDILDGITLSTQGGSILNVTVDLKGKTTDEILNYLGGIFGKTWNSTSSSGVFNLPISNDIYLIFYPFSTYADGNSPTIAIFYDGSLYHFIRRDSMLFISY